MAQVQLCGVLHARTLNVHKLKHVTLLSGHAFQLPVPVQLAHDLRIVAPVFLHLHVQLQKNLRAQDFFQFLARFRPDFLQRCAAACRSEFPFALRAPRRSSRGCGSAGPFPQTHPPARRRRAELPAWCPPWPFRGQFPPPEIAPAGRCIDPPENAARLREDISMNFSSTRSTPSPVSAEIGIISAKSPIFRQRSIDRKQLGFRNAVNLVQQQNACSAQIGARAPRRGGLPAPNSSLASRIRASDVHCIDRSIHFAHHLPAQRGVRPVQPGRIDQNDLRIRAIHDSLNAIACGLRPRRDDRDFFSDQPVHQRGFPRVGTPYDRDEPGFEFLRHVGMIPHGAGSETILKFSNFDILSARTEDSRRGDTKNLSSIVP